jgi:hypothetical protein
MRASRLVSGLLAAFASMTGCSDSTTSGTVAPRTDGPGGTSPPAGTKPTPTPATTPDASAAGPGDSAPDPAPVPYQAFDLNHVLSTGQSNSVAHEGKPVLSTTQPYGNLSFDVGVMTSGVCEADGCRVYQKPSGFVPLVEGDTFWYPVETMSSGLANEATKLAKEKYGKPSHDVLVSLAGRNGLTYWCLRKGGCNFIDPTYVNSFEESMMQVDDGKRLAAAAGKSYVVRAVTLIHGESDDFAYATNTQQFPNDGTDGSFKTIKDYGDALIAWQSDFEDGVRARTGQTLPVPLLVSQFSGWNDIATSAVTQMQLDAHMRAPGKVVIVAPAYVLEWAADCRHYTGDGERQLGAYFAKAYTRIVIEGRPWEPVRPRSITRAGNVVTARFHVPVPPLVLDTERVTNPGNYGFAVVDAQGADLPIMRVALNGPDTVSITLAEPVPASAKLRYAFTTVPHSCPGRFAGARGNLRDSDKAASPYGYELFDWGVHFELPIVEP